MILLSEIGVDAPVLAVAPAAHRHHRRAVAEVETEFFLDRAAQRRPSQGGNETGKDRPACQAFDRVTAVTGDGWEIVDERAELVAAHKILDDDKVERVAAQRRPPQAIKIEQRQRRAPVIVAIALKYNHSPSLWPNRLS